VGHPLNRPETAIGGSVGLQGSSPSPLASKSPSAVAQSGCLARRVVRGGSEGGRCVGHGRLPRRKLRCMQALPQDLASALVETNALPQALQIISWWWTRRRSLARALSMARRQSAQHTRSVWCRLRFQCVGLHRRIGRPHPSQRKRSSPLTYNSSA
jgi:hypothetical protein